jgi:hydroxymethylpyrimidine pyrophosphatase-like HAD family hydrolase
MKYSNLVLDVDGTLLNPENKLSDVTLNALQRYQKRGGTVIIATGKLYKAIAKRFNCKLLRLSETDTPWFHRPAS